MIGNWIVGLCAFVLAASSAAHAAEGRTMARKPVAAKDRPTTHGLTANPAIHPLNTMAWNQISTVALTLDRAQRPQESLLSFPVERRGKPPLVVEQRFYPLHYASPMAVIDGLRKVLTRGVGQVEYAPVTANLRVLDSKEILERVAKYIQAMDTPKPARMIVVPPDAYADALRSLKERLSANAEIVEFPDEGVMIVRDDERRLGGVEMSVRKRLAPPGAMGPASRPVLTRRIPIEKETPQSR